MATTTKLTRKELAAAAEDLNKTLRLYPPIGHAGEVLTEEEIEKIGPDAFREEVEKALKVAAPKKLTESALREALSREAQELTADDDVRPNTRAVLEALVIPHGEKENNAEKGKKVDAKEGKKAEKKKAEVAPSPSSPKKRTIKKAEGDGVIGTIVRVLKERGPVTKEEILKQLCKAFPDRAEKSMKGTINCQVPNRLNREKGLKITKTKDGAYKIGR